METETKIRFENVSDKVCELRKSEDYKNMDSVKRIGCDLIYGGICIFEGISYLLGIAAEQMSYLIERIVGGGH